MTEAMKKNWNENATGFHLMEIQTLAVYHISPS